MPLKVAPALFRKRADDEAAFERLYERHVEGVFRYAVAMLGDQADAEDVTQTTFLNAYRAFKSGTRPDKANAWLIAIAHNVCRQRFRQAQRRPREVEFDERIGEPEVVEPTGPTADELRRALSELPPNQRSALVMRELEGCSYSEIAGVLGVSVSALEALLFRARRALREQLEERLSCHEAALAINRQLDGRLGAGERRALRAHLRACEDCNSFAQSQRAQRRALKSLVLVPLPHTLAQWTGAKTAAAASAGGTAGASGAGGGGGAGGLTAVGATSGGAGISSAVLGGAGIAAKLAAVVVAGMVVGGTYEGLTRMARGSSGDPARAANANGQALSVRVGKAQNASALSAREAAGASVSASASGPGQTAAGTTEQSASSGAAATHGGHGLALGEELNSTAATDPQAADANPTVMAAPDAQSPSGTTSQASTSSSASQGSPSGAAATHTQSAVNSQSVAKAQSATHSNSTQAAANSPSAAHSQSATHSQAATKSESGAHSQAGGSQSSSTAQPPHGTGASGSTGNSDTASHGNPDNTPQGNATHANPPDNTPQGNATHGEPSSPTTTTTTTTTQQGNGNGVGTGNGGGTGTGGGTGGNGKH
jgi:RNA polymerase sigma factor (sigma-70 family)